MKKHIHFIHIIIGLICVPVALFTHYGIRQFGGPVLFQLLPLFLIVLWVIGYWTGAKTGERKWMFLNVLVFLMISGYIIYSVVS